MEIKTANEYKKNYLSLYDKIFELENEIKNKLFDLCKKHPDAPIGMTPDGTIIKAGGIANKSYISRIDFQTSVAFMSEIEKHIQKGLPVQLEIPFNK